MIAVEGSVRVNTDRVFYNPRMRVNRDICVAMVSELGIKEYLDAFSASGVRGIRVRKEAGVERVVMNDISTSACQRIRENLALNDISDCEVTCESASVIMSKRRFEAIDLDPFGSPAQFLAPAASSARSYLFITATDTAPLCGAHLRSGIRKYLAVPLNTEYHREMGVRILMGAVIRELARADRRGIPLLSYATEHYVRLHLRIKKGAREADEALESMGYVEHCFGCGGWSLRMGMGCKSSGTCSFCGGKTCTAGPLWLGPLHDKDILKAALNRIEPESRAHRLVLLCSEEVDVPFYYDHHKICRRLRITPSKVESVISDLLEHGYRASRTHFTGVGIKTDAPLRDLVSLLA